MAEAQAERVASNVVTSENRAEFMQHRMDLQKPLAEVKEEVKTEVKTEEKKEEKKLKAEEKHDEEEKDEEVKQVRKGNPKIEQRFSDLTKQRKEKEAEAAAAKEETARAKEEARLAKEERDALKAKYEAPKPLGEKPTRDKFATDGEFEKALETYTENKTRSEIKVEQETQARVKAWQDRQAATRAEVPDYDVKLAASTVALSNEVRDAILDSEHGPKLLYHLATHPDEAEALGKLTVGQAFKRLGALEERVSKPAQVEEKEEKKEVKQTEKTPVAEISKAPAPISPLRGANAPAEVPVDDKGEFRGSFKQFKSLRKAGKIE